MKFRFEKRFFIISILALAIGLFLFYFSSGWVRNYLGDVIAVICLYSILSSFISSSIIFRAGVVFALAFFIEILQALFQLSDHAFIQLTLGSSFDTWDILAYIFGIIVIIIYERIIGKNKHYDN